MSTNYRSTADLTNNRRSIYIPPFRHEPPGYIISSRLVETWLGFLGIDICGRVSNPFISNRPGLLTDAAFAQQSEEIKWVLLNAAIMQLDGIPYFARPNHNHTNNYQGQRECAGNVPCRSMITGFSSLPTFSAGSSLAFYSAR